MATCIYCSKEFIPCSGSKGLYCSRECTSAALGESKRKAHIEKYNNAPKLCKHCHTPIPYDKRNGSTFCNSSCAAQYNNKQRVKNGWCRTTESKQRVSKSISEYKAKVRPERAERAPYTRIEYVHCEVCGKSFVSYGNPDSYYRMRFCSSDCRSVRRSEVGRNNPGLGTKRSKQEVELFELCKSAFSNVTSNEKLVDGWDADVVIHDIRTAILWNGPWHYREMNFGNHSLKQVQNRDRIKIKKLTDAGWVVKVFEDREYTPISAFNELMGN